MPVAPGTALHLRFRHSMYGSLVEEIFAVNAEGFILTELRYGEARLVEFYGHEQATRRNDTWVITPAPTSLPSLTLRLSRDAAASLSVVKRDHTVDIPLQPDAAHRLSVTSCGTAVDG